jgi:hypothetical protein
MKISKERRQLCDDVTNSHKIEARRRRAKEVERHLDSIFMYVLLFTMGVVGIVMLIDWWGSL